MKTLYLLLSDEDYQTLTELAEEQRTTKVGLIRALLRRYAALVEQDSPRD